MTMLPLLLPLHRPLHHLPSLLVHLFDSVALPLYHLVHLDSDCPPCLLLSVHLCLPKLVPIINPC